MRQDLLIAVADAHLDQMDAVVERLRAAGLDVQEADATIGTVTGSIDSARVDALRALDGVDAVEEQTSYELPPPDESIQ